MDIANLIKLAEAERIAPVKAVRSKWVQLVPVVEKLPSDWAMTSKMQWLVEQGAVHPDFRKKAYEALRRVFRMKELKEKKEAKERKAQEKAIA